MVNRLGEGSLTNDAGRERCVRCRWWVERRYAEHNGGLCSYCSLVAPLVEAQRARVFANRNITVAELRSRAKVEEDAANARQKELKAEWFTRRHVCRTCKSTFGTWYRKDESGVHVQVNQRGEVFCGDCVSVTQCLLQFKERSAQCRAS